MTIKTTYIRNSPYTLFIVDKDNENTKPEHYDDLDHVQEDAAKLRKKGKRTFIRSGLLEHADGHLYKYIGGAACAADPDPQHFAGVFVREHDDYMIYAKEGDAFLKDLRPHGPWPAPAELPTT